MHDELIFNLIFFIILFIFVYIICYYFLGRIKPKKKDGKKGKPTFKLMSEGRFLILRYNLDEKKINLKSFNRGICLCNAFIISFTSTVISVIPLNMFFQLAIGFVLLFALIYAIFEIYGRHLNKKWGKYNDREL